MESNKNNWNLGKIVFPPTTATLLKKRNKKEYKRFINLQYICVREATESQCGILVKVLGKTKADNITFVCGQPFCNDDEFMLFEGQIISSYSFPTVAELREVLNIIRSNPSLLSQFEAVSMQFDPNSIFWVNKTGFHLPFTKKPRCYDASTNRLCKAPKDSEPCRLTMAYFNTKHELVEPDVIVSTVEEPIVEEPIVEEAIVEEPIVEEPIVKEPIVEEPIVEEPTVEESIVEEPIIEEPIVEEPIAEEPIIEEPTVEKPTVEKPTVEKPIVEKPIVEKPEGKSSIWRVFLIIFVVILLVGAFLAGKYVSSLNYSGNRDKNSVTKSVTEETISTEKNDAPSQQKDTISQPKKKETVSKPEKKDTLLTQDQYEAMDIRLKTGAYRIIGTDKIITVKPGDNLTRICNHTLGPGMECYIEVYNNIKPDAPLEPGKEIKIPKVNGAGRSRLSTCLLHALDLPAPSFRPTCPILKGSSL